VALVLMSIIAVTEAVVCPSAGIEGVLRRTVPRTPNHPWNSLR
jgi:hypothetical protein